MCINVFDDLFVSVTGNVKSWASQKEVNLLTIGELRVCNVSSLRTRFLFSISERILDV